MGNFKWERRLLDASTHLLGTVDPSKRTVRLTESSFYSKKLNSRTELSGLEAFQALTVVAQYAHTDPFTSATDKTSAVFQKLFKD
jgi:hypothetical protein